MLMILEFNVCVLMVPIIIGVALTAILASLTSISSYRRTKSKAILVQTPSLLEPTAVSRLAATS